MVYTLWRVWSSVEENGTYGASGVVWCGVVSFDFFMSRGVRWVMCMGRSVREVFVLVPTFWKNFSFFLFSSVFCDGYVMMANFSWRQRRYFLMLWCRQVLVWVSPRWLWERCLCILGAICIRIKRCWMRSFCFWKKVYDCKFLVL